MKLNDLRSIDQPGNAEHCANGLAFFRVLSHRRRKLGKNQITTSNCRIRCPLRSFGAAP